MRNQFQKEIPKARVNITLDVDHQGAQKKTELPMKLLVLGNFSSGKNTSSLADRERIAINQHNFDRVLQDINPTLDYSVPNVMKEEAELYVTLSIKTAKDFRPESIIRNVPELNRLLAMRNLLKELRSNISDNKTFQKDLNTILADSDNKKLMKQNLELLRAKEEGVG